MEREMGFGTRALAMGGSYTSLADDYTSLYWNPAGLAAMRNSTIFGEFSNLNFSNEVVYADEGTTDSQFYNRPAAFGMTVPLPTTRGSLVFAFGFSHIADFDENLRFSGFSRQNNQLGFEIKDESSVSSFYLFNRNVQRAEEITNEGGIDQFSIAAGIALSPNTTLGVTVSRLLGEENFRFLFEQNDSIDEYINYPGDFHSYSVSRRLNVTHDSYLIKVGGIVKAGNLLALGGTFSLPTNMRMREDYSSSEVLIFDDGFEADTAFSGIWNYEVSLPWYVDGGASFSSRFLTLSAAARYRDWSDTQYDLADADMNDPQIANLSVQNDSLRLNYRATIEIHTGAELTVPLISQLPLSFRVGYALYPSPSLGSDTSDEDKQFTTAGLGVNIMRNITLDITYLYGKWKQRSSDNYTPGGTHETITATKFLIGLSFSF
jgi:long-chain fatty acid transport protein